VATPLELSTQAGADGIPVVTVAGEIDMSNADRFRDALGLAAAAADGGSFVVDLTGAEYLDSAGVHALFAHASRIRLIAGPLLEPVLTISGLAGITSAGGVSAGEPQ
jgi:anti-anti-sigma factor